MSKIQKQHIVFVTIASLEDNGRIKDEDLARINTISEKLYSEDINARRFLFITEGSLASLETAYQMEDQICYWGKRGKEEMRKLCLKFDFWLRSELKDIIQDIFYKKMLDEDLWLFIGTPKYILRIMAVLLPDQYEIYGMFPGEIPSAMCIGSTVNRESFLEVKLNTRDVKSMN